MNENSDLKTPMANGEILSEGVCSTVGDYLEMTKPRLTFLVLLTTLVGYCMGSRNELNALRLLHTILGTACVAGGAAALNQFLERNLDARMKRTEDRPIPAGRVRPQEGLIYGIFLGAAGMIWLFVLVNPFSSLLSAISFGSYVLVYTPLKTRTPLCTLVGAVPGAIPPMIGWVAATGGLEAGAWSLFALLFFWQMPHFYALSHMYQEDYARGGYPMLSVCGPSGDRTAREIRFYTAGLIPISLLPVLLGMNGWIYLVGASGVSLGFAVCGWKAARLRNIESSRRLFFASIFYLPLLLTLMVATKRSL